MRIPTRLVALLVFLVASTVLALGCESMPGMAASREPTLPWNQQLATALASKLEVATEAAYNAVRESPETLEPEQMNPDLSMENTLREMHEEAGGLYSELQKGQGMQDTLERYRRIKELSRDVGESEDYTDETSSLASPLGGVSTLLHQLDAYYGDQ